MGKSSCIIIIVKDVVYIEGLGGRPQAALCSIFLVLKLLEWILRWELVFFLGLYLLHLHTRENSSHSQKHTVEKILSLKIFFVFTKSSWATRGCGQVPVCLSTLPLSSSLSHSSLSLSFLFLSPGDTAASTLLLPPSHDFTAGE